MQLTLLMNIFSFVAVFLFFNSADAKGTKSSFNPQIQNEYLAKYFNSFESLGDLMEGMQYSGFFGPEDGLEIRLKLKEIGVDPKAKLPFVKAEGNSIRFGTTAVLIFDSNGKIKTGDGHFINIKKEATITDIFMQAVQLQMGKKVASLLGLFVIPAWADSVDNVEAVESALGLVASHLGGAIIGDVGAPITGVIAGAFGGGVNFITWAMRTWLKKGTVKCVENTYAALGFEDGRSLKEIWNGEKPKGLSDNVDQICAEGQRYKDGFSTLMTGHLSVLCKVTFTGVIYAEESFQKRNKYYYPIKDAVLKKELGDPIPGCTDELASSLTDKLKARLRAAVDAAKQGKPSRLVRPWEFKGGVH